MTPAAPSFGCQAACDSRLWTKRHDGAGDFPAWFAERRAAPRPTLFIKGNHEDFVWLDAQSSSEVLPGLHYLRNGHVHELVAGDEVLRVGGVGGCFGPSNFERRSSTLQGYAKRHYTRDEIAMLSAHADLDIVLTHDAPAGVRFERHRRGEGFVSEAMGLDGLLACTRPRVCFFGHHHTRFDSEVAGVRCVGLNKGHYPGCLVAFEMNPGVREWQRMGLMIVSQRGGITHLAGLTGMPQPSLSRFFNTNSMPRRGTLLKIAKALDLDAVQIATEWTRE